MAADNAPESVSPEHGDIYIADSNNQRIDVLSPTGAFVLMFGKDVNKTTKANLCTAVSQDTCQAGTPGGEPGQLWAPTSITIDPTTGNVYVEEFLNWRVQEFTATGEPVLMIGKEVNKTTKGNLCTLASKDECTAGKQAQNSTEPSTFNFNQLSGTLLTIAGPENLLYVGDRHRVEIFTTEGIEVSEISLTSISSEEISRITTLAVDKTGDIYVNYSTAAKNLIYEFGPNGVLIQIFELATRGLQATQVEVSITSIAIDPAGRIEVAERETGGTPSGLAEVLRGTLYEVNGHNLHPLTEGAYEFQTDEVRVIEPSVGFDGEDHMYVTGGSEVLAYRPVPVAALSATGAKCVSGVDSQSDATYQCDLGGEVDPEGVSETEVWFQWGETLGLGMETSREPVEGVSVSLPMSVDLTGLLPNKTYYYRLAGLDQNVQLPELLASETVSFETPAAAPRLIGEPSVSYVEPFSVVMFGELNPENSPTKYAFQYWPCVEATRCEACAEPAGCPELSETEPVQSPAYGAIGTTVEASGLSPGTTYDYRLLAKNAAGEVKSELGAFTTEPGPAVTAQTGAASAVGTTSAIVSGVVNPDGQAATYVFELGRNSANPQMGVVSSAPTGSGTGPLVESIALTGLQPGTTYAYRIAIHSGDGSGRGESAAGTVLTFTTPGLPEVFKPNTLPQLEVPPTKFPQEPTKTKPTNKQKLAAALKVCKKKPKKQRKSCESKAHKKYPTSNK